MDHSQYCKSNTIATPSSAPTSLRIPGGGPEESGVASLPKSEIGVAGIKHSILGLALLLAAGCGNGTNYAAVTPVMARTVGTYRLQSSETTSGTGTTAFVPYSSGTLRLKEDSSYIKTVVSHGATIETSGVYALGTSVNTILNTRTGVFSLTSTIFPSLAGNYQVIPDDTLILDYPQFQPPLREIWIKVSDLPSY